MSYPWWHIRGTFADGTTHDFNATDMTPRYAMETLLTAAPPHQESPVAEVERQHGDLLKLEVLHPSTPGLDPETEKCPDCART